MAEVDQYLSQLPANQRAELERIRRIVHTLVPTAQETISYGMPVFKHNRHYLIGMAAFKNHLSIFPGAEAVAQLKDKLTEFKLSKGTIQFTTERPLPESVIKSAVRLRMQAISEEAR